MFPRKTPFRLMLALALLSLPSSGSRAQDDIIQQFITSMSNVYLSSDACRNTLSPGPAQYMRLISDYLAVLYPGGADYWVLPHAREALNSRSMCIDLLKLHLREYADSSRSFARAYPGQPAPPVLVAYDWPAQAPGQGEPQGPIIPEFGTRTAQ